MSLLDHLPEADRAAVAPLFDTYNHEEYSARVRYVRGFTELTFRLLPEAAEELQQVPRDIVYHVDASGRAKLGGVS